MLHVLSCFSTALELATLKQVHLQISSGCFPPKSLYFPYLFSLPVFFCVHATSSATLYGFSLPWIFEWSRLCRGSATSCQMRVCLGGGETLSHPHRSVEPSHRSEEMRIWIMYGRSESYATTHVFRCDQNIKHRPLLR